MAFGGGKYEDICTYVREKAKANGAIVIVIKGKRGSGFSCQLPEAIIGTTPDLLEELAREIRADNEKGWA